MFSVCGSVWAGHADTHQSDHQRPPGTRALHHRGEGQNICEGESLLSALIGRLCLLFFPTANYGVLIIHPLIEMDMVINNLRVRSCQSCHWNIESISFFHDEVFNLKNGTRASAGRLSVKYYWRYSQCWVNSTIIWTWGVLIKIHFGWTVLFQNIKVSIFDENTEVIFPNLLSG